MREELPGPIFYFIVGVAWTLCAEFMIWFYFDLFTK